MSNPLKKDNPVFLCRMVHISSVSIYSVGWGALNREGCIFRLWELETFVYVSILAIPMHCFIYYSAAAALQPQAMKPARSRFKHASV